MKQILISLMTISIVSLMLVGGAFATFSDNDASAGNTITAGTLDLAIGGDTALSSTLVNIDNFMPGDYEEVDIQVTNQGSQSGNAWMWFTDIACDTNAVVEPEVMAENELTAMGEATGDLSSQIIVSVNGVEMGTMDDIDTIRIGLNELQPAGAADAGMKVTLGFEFLETAGNEYQGDTCEFTLVFGIDQIIDQS